MASSVRLKLVACLVAFVGVALAGVFSPWPAPIAGLAGIEDDLVDKTTERLGALGATQAIVTADGQNLTVELPAGLPPGVGRNALINDLEAEWGVRTVTLIGGGVDGEAGDEGGSGGDDPAGGADVADGASGSTNAGDAIAGSESEAGEEAADDAAAGADDAEAASTTAFVVAFGDGRVALTGEVETDDGQATLVRAAETLTGDPAKVDADIAISGGSGSDLETIAAVSAAVRRLGEWFTDAELSLGPAGLSVQGTAVDAAAANRASQVIDQLAQRVDLAGSVDATIPEPDPASGSDDGDQEPAPDDEAASAEGDADDSELADGAADGADSDQPGADDEGASAEGADGEPTDDGADVDIVSSVGAIDLSGVTFQAGTAELTAEGQAALDEVAAQLVALGDLGKSGIEVGGHTGEAGDPDVDLLLSHDRAEAVRAQLVERGVDESSLTARGYGSSQPVGDNSTAEGQAANRRIELVVTEGTN